MLTVAQIERLVESREFGRLAARIVENGRCDAAEEAEVRRRIDAGCGLEPAALGLALQRMCELTYAPCPPARTPAARLIGSQRADGLWGDGRYSVAASAMALRGLLDYERLHDECRMTSPNGLEAAIDRGARALTSLQRVDGSIGRDGLDNLIVMWQLGGSHPYLPIRFFDLRRAIERKERPREYRPLHRLACAAAA